MSQPSSIHDSENQVDTHSDSAAADNQPNPADAFEVLLIPACPAQAVPVPPIRWRIWAGT